MEHIFPKVTSLTGVLEKKLCQNIISPSHLQCGVLFTSTSKNQSCTIFIISKATGCTYHPSCVPMSSGKPPQGLQS